MSKRSPSVVDVARLVGALWLALPLGGCAFGSTPPPPRNPIPIYAVWEVDTLAELDQLLDIKGCEGWRFDQAFARGDKLVAIIERDGPAPPPNPACRPASP